MLADVWAVMTLAVLRPRHAQRSRLTDIRAEGLVGTASEANWRSMRCTSGRYLLAALPTVG